MLHLIDDKHHDVPANLIEPDPDQPRVEAGAELTESIESQGQIDPIHVRQHPVDPGKFMIVNGERRWRAISSIGEDAPVKCILVDDMDADELFMVQLTSNMARQDLTLPEEVRAIKRLTNMGYGPGFIAKSLGLSETTVTSDVVLAELPDDMLKKIDENHLPKQVARAIAKNNDPEKALKAAMRGQGTTSMLARVERLTKQQAGEEESTPEYDAKAGKALDKLITRVSQFSKKVDTASAVAARSKKLDDIHHLAATMRRLAGELEKAAASHEAKAA